MGVTPTRQLSLQPVAIGAVVETAEAFGVEGHLGDSASMRAATRGERRAGPEKGDVEADPNVETGKAGVAGEVSETCTQQCTCSRSIRHPYSSI